MTGAPYYTDGDVTLHRGDALLIAQAMPSRSVQTIVTSPPYFGLRDYGHDAQLGAEPTVGEYVANMVALFRELRRVLTDDGTLWLNLGDSYAGGIPHNDNQHNQNRAGTADHKARAMGDALRRSAKRPDGGLPSNYLDLSLRTRFAAPALNIWNTDDEEPTA